MVLAGAGSGKTRVITEKVAWLIKNQQVKPEKIVAVTFTNKAAREMKARVASLFETSTDSKQRVKGLTVSTFHSLGMRILKSNLELAGLRRGFTIVDPSDALNVVIELAGKEDVTKPEIAEQLLNTISTWKNAAIGPGREPLDEPNPITALAAKIYGKYDHYLRVCNSVDLDDLIALPTQLLHSDAEFLKHWRERIQYLLIDEYQDTNGSQYQMVRLLVNQGAGLTVVGDDDQSIYSWRGARPENLITLSQDFPDLKIVKLEQNYRSAGRILNIANQLISQNPRPFSKTLWSELGYGDAVTLKSAKNDEQEAEQVVSAIMSHQFRFNSDFQDFAVLYRSNHQARIVEIKLREMRIPYRLSGGLSFFERSEIRDIMAYLRLLTNPSDDAAFLRIINTPRRGIGATTLEKIAQLASSKQQSMLDTLLDRDLANGVKPKLCERLKQFAQWIVQSGDDAERGDPVRVVKEMLDTLDYHRWLMDSSDEAAAQRRWENVNALVGWIENLATGEEEDSALSEILSQIILSDILDRQQQDSDHNQVSLMTLHASKGLEFKHVFIIGLEEDILPHRVSVLQDAVEEERRLFYVGITRAMQSLSLSYCRLRKRYGEMVRCDPSRFLEELPKEELQWDQDPADIEQNQASGRAHLANIRARRGASP